ncbi:hypothetical protein AWZ03_001910 [Drosophila navojoa]|uniref:G-protein coupled receptors family 1 profile domain-containing protein n=2 Tax=Drosophila navojoa TaxID=7232 RepID=A0A484BUV3_DRONA|nr:hypothetical protein AWZ03_001910 [Drosophila navojoa]
MARATNFNDALDYIYIANSMDNKAYLIADPRPDEPADEDMMQQQEEEEEEQPQLTGGDSNNNSQYYNDGDFPNTAAAVAAVAAAAALENNANSSSPSFPSPNSSPGSPLATAALAAAAASASVAAAAARITAKAAHRALGSKAAIDLIDADGSKSADNNYTNVAVGLGAMLLNDTLLLEGMGNETMGGLGIFGDLVNGSGPLLNGSAAINVTASKVAEDDFTQLLRMAITTVLLGLMILVTIIGNVFVIAAIILERNLQNVANYLVASLAVADLFVACLVMPLGAVYEISQGWILGPELCDIWTSCDVLCCTASILHLVAIAVDR